MHKMPQESKSNENSSLFCIRWKRRIGDKEQEFELSIGLAMVSVAVAVLKSGYSYIYSFIYSSLELLSRWWK